MRRKDFRNPRYAYIKCLWYVQIKTYICIMNSFLRICILMYVSRWLLHLTVKVLRQKHFVASCTCRPLQKTFAKPLILSLKSIYEQCHFELSYKKFHGHAKKRENHETFLPRNFHGIKYHTYIFVHIIYGAGKS